jgi:diguanylate cyclase (GGDEF)-like protein/PAS domain S-box-containing protein
MRKALTFEAERKLHRRRGRALIAASLAVLVGGTTLSITVALARGADRLDAAQARFNGAVALQRASVERTVRSYRRMLTVTEGFLSVRQPSSEQFLGFAESLELADAHPAVIALQFIDRVPYEGSDDFGYPVTMVAPRSAAPLLGEDLAGDPSVREALETVGERGGVTLTPPEPNIWQQPRMQLIAPVRRHGRFVGWVGATLDPEALAREMLTDIPDGVRVGVRWDDDALLGPARGPVDTSEALLFETSERVVVDGTPWTIDAEATATFDPQAGGISWVTLVVGLTATFIAALALFLLGRSRIAALDLAARLGMDLAASQARAKAVMDSAVEAIVTTDASGHIESVNPAAEALFGWTEAESLGRPAGDLVAGLALAGGAMSLSSLTFDERESMMEARRKDGSTVPVDVTLSGTSVGGREMFTVIARDATVRKLHEDQLEHQATHDPLTGLANRKLFDELLVRAVFRSERSRRAIAVLYLDLDGFKDVNDVFGHAAGDRVLSETARRLESVIRPGDIVARLGGDEFVVLCENLVSPEDAEKIATRIVQAVGKPIPVAAGVATVTASVGIALSSIGESAASIVARADEAMYRTKQDGKAGYRFATAVIN